MSNPMYLGMTQEDYDEYFIYDKDNGILLGKKTGSRLGSPTEHGLITSIRVKKKVKTVYIGKLCYFLNHNVNMSSGSKIKYLDDDYTNLRPNNLKLVGKVNIRVQSGRFLVKETETKGVFFNPNNNHFVVRRGDEQAVYRTLSYQEAVALRLEWESDKSIHRWDRFSERFSKFL